MRNFISNALYIVSDGTSAFQIYGCDIEDQFDDLEVLKGPFADTPSNQYKIESMVEKYNDEINGTNMFNENIKRINESQLRRIVSESVKDVLRNAANKLGGFKEGKPTSLKDEITGMGWKIGKVKKGNQSLLVQVFSSYNPFGNNHSLDELAEDINIYLEDKGNSMRATAIENSNGAFIKISR